MELLKAERASTKPSTMVTVRQTSTPALSVVSIREIGEPWM